MQRHGVHQSLEVDFCRLTLMCGEGTLKSHVCILESTEHQRRERKNESKLSRAPEPTWQ